jgi:hypothetical protein
MATSNATAAVASPGGLIVDGELIAWRRASAIRRAVAAPGGVVLGCAGDVHWLRTRLPEDLKGAVHVDESVPVEATSAAAEEWTRVWTDFAAVGYRVDAGVLDGYVGAGIDARHTSLARFGVDVTGGDDRAAARWLVAEGVDLPRLIDGDRSVQREWLERAASRYQSVDLASVADLRAKATLASQAKQVRAHVRDGRIHPVIHPAGCSTGRMRVAEPALQAMPPQIRSAILAEPGQVWVRVDISAADPAMAAHLSGDDQLGEDVHTGVYDAVAEHLEVGRPAAKTIVMGLLYGMGQERLADKLDTAPGDARRLRASLLGRWPIFADYARRLQRSVESGSELRTWGGRPVRPDAAYKAVSHMVQGSSADLARNLCLSTFRELDGLIGSALAVHDELAVSVPAAEASRALAVLDRWGDDPLVAAVSTSIDGVRLGK